VFVYIQSTGELYETSLDTASASALRTKADLVNAAHIVGMGYSGHGPGRNNPAMEAVHDIGPIPHGLYKIGKPECCAPDPPGPHGPYILPLSPNGHSACGRSGFLMHGDNVRHDASLGCIIQLFTTREHVGISGCDDLLVTDFPSGTQSPPQ
jgi:hypothetical protein